MATDQRTVAEFVGDDLPTLEDFATYVLGLDRNLFQQSCNIRREQDRETFDKCWTVFYEWQVWTQGKQL